MAATVGYTPQFPCLHKDSVIHQDYVKHYTPPIEPGSQPMDDVEDVDELSLNLSNWNNGYLKKNVQIIWNIKQAKEGRKEKDQNNN